MSQVSDIKAAAPDRRARRRLETRGKLLAAARTVFAAQGVESTRINDITEQADVGFGSFYNHFESKEAIAEAVLRETVAAQAARLDALTADLDDPAEIVATAHRYFIHLARTDPDWAWLLIRLEISHHVAVSALGPFAARDLRAGVRAGRFAVTDEATTLNAAGGALLAVMRGVLDGRLAAGADIAHAEGILRAFGIGAGEAAEIAARPLPVGPPTAA